MEETENEPEPPGGDPESYLPQEKPGDSVIPYHCGIPWALGRWDTAPHLALAFLVGMCRARGRPPSFLCHGCPWNSQHGGSCRLLHHCHEAWLCQQGHSPWGEAAVRGDCLSLP